MRRLTTHPGEILSEDFMIPLGLSARAVAAAIDVPPNRVTAIVNGERAVTADTAIRLGLHFNTTSQFWLNLQQAYDLSKAEREGDFKKIKPRVRDAAA